MTFIRRAVGGVEDAGILLLLITLGLPLAVLVVGAPVALVVWTVTFLVRLL